MDRIALRIGHVLHGFRRRSSGVHTGRYSVFHNRNGGVILVLDDVAENVMKIVVVGGSLLHPRSANLFVDVPIEYEVSPALLRQVSGIATEKVGIGVEADAS